MRSLALTRLRRIRASAEAGMTLTELLVTMVILAVIIGPLTAALIVYLRNTDATLNRMVESHDAQLAAAYFAHDVQNAGIRDWSAPPYTDYQASVWLGAAANESATHGCGSDPTASIVRFAWDDPAATIDGHQIRSATYLVKPIDAAVGELHRITCAGGTLLADITIAHNVDLAQPPTVACPDDAPSCTASTTPPGAVKLTLGIRAPGSSNTYIVELFGQRRQT